MLGDKPVRFTSKVSLARCGARQLVHPAVVGADAPRQVARAGHGRRRQQEIIALSEEYQIITPYTSLLVLESDADRERFAVKRRFQMRDGEKFFAAAATMRRSSLTAEADEEGRRLSHSAAADGAGATRSAWAATPRIFQPPRRRQLCSWVRLGGFGGGVFCENPRKGMSNYSTAAMKAASMGRMGRQWQRQITPTGWR